MNPLTKTLLCLLATLPSASVFADGVVHIPEPVGGWAYPYGSSGTWWNPANATLFQQGITFDNDFAILPTIDGLSFVARNAPTETAIFEFAGYEVQIASPGGGSAFLSVGGAGDYNLYVTESIVTGGITLSGFGHSGYLELYDHGVNFGDSDTAADTLLSRASLGTLQINGQTIVTQNNLANYVTLSGTQTLTNKTIDAGQLSGSVTAAKGGTGQTSYTTGDLLYAGSSSTLSKLPAATTGNALVSGGTGAAPSWGKIGLTTHVTGTLPVANGGTGATTLTGILKGNGTGAVTTVTAPAGAIVGTTDTQTLSNKTFSGAVTFQNAVTINGNLNLPNQSLTGGSSVLTSDLADQRYPLANATVVVQGEGASGTLYGGSTPTEYATALGAYASANDRAAALGHLANAATPLSVAIGHAATVNEPNSGGAHGTVAHRSSSEQLDGNSYSIVIGSNAYTEEGWATVLGPYASAEFYSVALGGQASASGEESVALGGSAIASGFRATAVGALSSASGHNSTALGSGASAQGYGQIVLGQYNVAQGNSTNWVATDDLFTIGNGTSDTARSNAFVIKKNGNTSINGGLTVTGAVSFSSAPTVGANAIVTQNQLSAYQTSTGSGASLTSLNADALATGTVPAARLPVIELASGTEGTLEWARVTGATATVEETEAGTETNKAVTPASLKDAGYLRVATDSSTGRITTAIRIEPQGDILMGEFGPTP